MGSGVEKVDSAGGGSQHRDAARLRQLRALCLTLLVAVFAAAPLAAQQEQQRVVRGLSFEGNHALDDYTLSSAIATTNSSAFATKWFLRWIPWLGEKRYFNELEFRRDVIRLLLLYRQSGYMNAVVDTLVRREGRDVYVKSRIYEGDPVRLAALDILGLDSILDVRRLKRDLPLQVGDPFNRALFKASADTIVSRLKNIGYPYADVLRNYDVDVAALRAVATLEALPGPRRRVGQVLITGAEKVDTGTIRRMLSVKVGDWFRQDQLYLTQRDLYGLGMFRSVNVVLADTTPPPGDSVGVVVRVAEAPRHRIRVGAGYASLDCFRVQGGWTAYDFFGGARSLDLTGQLSKIGVGYGYSVGRTAADPAVYCQRFLLCNESDQAFLANRRPFGAITISGVRARVNSVLDPSVGSVTQVTLVHASRYVLSDTLYEFNRGELEISKYYPLSRRSVLAWRIPGGTILPQRLSLLGQSVKFVPPDQRFYAGGPNSVLGFARNELGPRVYVSDSLEVSGTDTTYKRIQASPTGGNTVFTANLELRVPSPIFPERVRLGVFVDVGQVWERGDTGTTVSGLRVTPGLGLRFITPLGPVRLDPAYYGYPQEPAPT